MYLNPGHGNNYIKIELRGVKTNKKGIGCRIFVYSTNSQTATESQLHHHVVSPGGSYGSNALESHIGLEKHNTITKVIVWWQATDIKQEFKNIRVNSKVILTEGQDDVTYIQEPTFVIDVKKLGIRRSVDNGVPKSCH